MKRVLIIVPFDNIYPPMNGGMQRCFHAIHQLAIHSDLTIIINQKKEEFLLAANEYPVIKKVKVYSTPDAPMPKDIFTILPQKLQKAFRYRWYKRKLKGPADGNFLKYYAMLRRLLKHQKYDAIILENIATLNAVSLIRKYDEEVRIVYNAHNVDTNLARAFLAKKEITEKRFLAIQKSESSLYKTVDAILACSRKDKDDFDRLNNGKLTISIIPNGVNVNDKLYDAGVRSDKPDHILFCGYLSTKPNSEGLLWFYQSIWSALHEVFPELKLLVVGSGNLPLEMKELYADPNLFFTGMVEDVRPFYNKASLSVVPLKTGSGTRLKILEAMSCGVPVISTSQGAEGIEYTDGFDIVIADEEKLFAENIIHLLKDKEQRLLIQKNARHVVERKYDWNIIGNDLSGFINNG